MRDFCTKIFPNIETWINDRKWLEGRLILATTNKEVLLINEMVTGMLPGTGEVFRSADQLENNDDLLRFNVEYLNSLTPNGFPPHNLILKPGMPLMLLRNLNPMQGLCNGTKLIFEESFANKVLKCRLIRSGETVLIPRIVLIPKENEYPFTWQRRKFPVKPAFSVTINKSQGNETIFTSCFYHLSTFFLLFFRSNPKQHWDLVAVSCVRSRTAVCCRFQSLKPRKSEICLNEGQKRWS